MSLHTDLPIYKKGCDLVQLAFNVQQQMPRSFKRTLGEKITVHCTDMLDLMALANAARGADRATYIQRLLQLQQITWGEYRQAARQCAAEITASGGKVVYLDEPTGAAA